MSDSLYIINPQIYNKRSFDDIKQYLLSINQINIINQGKKMKNKLLNIIGLGLAAILFTGCDAEFNSFLGIPNTKEEMISMNDDKELTQALSVIMDQKKDQSLDRVYTMGSVEYGKITVRAFNFVRFKDGYDRDSIRGNLSYLLENSLLSKIFIENATKRGNKVKAYTGKINSQIALMDSKFVAPMPSSNMTLMTSQSPIFIEFDKSNRIISVLTHYHEMFYELNNPRGNVSIDSSFFIYTGAKARSLQARLTQKVLEDHLMYDAN